MDKNKDNKKGGVKFTDPSIQKASIGVSTDQITEEKPKELLSPEECKKTAIRIYNQADAKYKLVTKNDPEIKRKDTARAVCKILDSLKEALNHIDRQNTATKDSLYYLTYNGTIYTFEMCRALRKSIYSVLTIKYIAYSILCLENSLNLIGVKFLDWRVKLYVELAHIYEDCDSYKAAGKAIEMALQKVQTLKDSEFSDPPVPGHVENIIENNFRILKVMDIKYKLNNGMFGEPSKVGDPWKKKIDEYFKEDVNGRNMAIIESLNPHYKKHGNLLKDGSAPEKAFSWKDQVLQFSYDMLKNDIELVSKAMEEMNEKIDMTLKIKEDYNMDDEARKELITKAREFENEMIFERQWKKASQNVPIELHIELLKHAYDSDKHQIYSDLLRTALVRCKYHRVEVPYIQDIDIQFSTIPNANIPNGYEKIDIDINEAHLRTELAKMRITIAKEIAQAHEEKKLEKMKEQKKGGKKGDDDSKPPHPDDIAIDPSKVNHHYIYFLVKRSSSPERAVYGVDIVMADPEKGPYDKIQQGWEAKAIRIDQYTGVRETKGMIPWLCLKHSDESLKNEEEKKTLVTDFLPLLSKSYLIRPPFGFEKIDVDLRQVPQQFYKIQNLDFVYATFKIDQMFFICERELFIIKELEELEKSFRGNKATSQEEEYKCYLELNYNIEKLQELAMIVKHALEGPLGDQFFDARKEFLLKLSFFIWKKYVNPALHQIETLYELVITEEIKSEEFMNYQKLLQSSASAFTEILEAISQVLTKSEKVDVLFLCRVNVELCKLLEDAGEFRKAAQILRFCYNKIIEYKDYTLQRGNESDKDILLPMTITCDNVKIQNMIEDMKNQYYQWKTDLRKLIRAKRREDQHKKGLDDDEANEEDYEFIEISKRYGNDDLKDNQYLESLGEKSRTNSEYLGIINGWWGEFIGGFQTNEWKER